MLLLTAAAAAEPHVTATPWSGDMFTSMPQLTDEVMAYYDLTKTQQELEDMVRGQGVPFSWSPNGENGLAVVNKYLMTISPEGAHMVIPAVDRGVEDRYGKLKKRLTKFVCPTADQVLWSPDSRYAVLTDYNQYKAMRTLDPVLIDTMTGEAILLAAYADYSPVEEMGSITSACFSRDGQYLYFILYGNVYPDKYSLIRCELSTLEVTYCTGISGQAYAPSLLQLEDGALVTSQLSEKNQQQAALSLMEYADDAWQSFSLPFGYVQELWRPWEICHVPGTNTAVVTGSLQQSTSGTAITGLAVMSDLTVPRAADYWVILRDSTLRQVTEAQMAAWDSEKIQFDEGLTPSPFCCDISPDGSELMVCYVDADQKTCLGLIDLATMTMQQVEGIPEDHVSIVELGTMKVKLEWSTESSLLLTRYGKTTLLQLTR